MSWGLVEKPKERCMSGLIIVAVGIFAVLGGRWLAGKSVITEIGSASLSVIAPNA
jgi:hypothetical protein